MEWVSAGSFQITTAYSERQVLETPLSARFVRFKGAILNPGQIDYYRVGHLQLLTLDNLVAMRRAVNQEDEVIAIPEYLEEYKIGFKARYYIRNAFVVFLIPSDVETSSSEQ